MTPRQRALYFREWSRVRAACKAAALPMPDRHELHRRALGQDKSSKDFNNDDLDAVLGVFRAISQPASLGSQLRQQRQPRARQEMSIEQILRCLALYVDDVDAYVASLCLARFHTIDWRELSDVKRPHKTNPHAASSPLDQFRWTLSGRLNGADGFRAQAGHSLHEMKTLAGVPCTCKACGNTQYAIRNTQYEDVPAELQPF